MRRCAILFNLFLPGSGHLLLGYSLRGLVLFFLFGLLLDAAIIGLYGPAARSSGDVLAMVSGLFAILLWGYGIYDVWWRAFGRLRDSLRAEKEKHFRAGIVHYLSADHEKAVKEFRYVLRLDDEDVDALYYAAMALKAWGRHGPAKRFFKKCQARDFSSKWRDEIARQLQEMNAGHKNL